MTGELRIVGTLLFHSETGTEGGYWAVQDGRGVHYESDLVDGHCPWGEESNYRLPDGEIVRVCPANPRAWFGDYQPETLAHASYYGLWIIRPGDRLIVTDKDDMTRTLYDDVVRLESQDPYGETSADAFGLAIHSTPVGQDVNAWARLFFEEHPCVLVKPNPTTYEVAQVVELDKLWKARA